MPLKEIFRSGGPCDIMVLKTCVGSIKAKRSKTMITEQKDFDVFNANKSYLLLHTTTAGKKTFDLNGKYKVKELFTNKNFGGKSASFTDDLPAKTTRIYQLTK